MKSEILEKRLTSYGRLSLAAAAATVAVVPGAQASVVSLTPSDMIHTTSAGTPALYFDPVLLISSPSSSFSTSPIGTGYSLQTDFSGPTKTILLSAGTIDQAGLVHVASTSSIQNLATGEFGSLANHIAGFGTFNSVYSTLAYQGQLPGQFKPTVTDATTGYIALKMFAGSDIYYGWANITVNTDYSVTLNGYAVETQPGTDIGTPSNTFTYDSVAPEPGSASLLLIALGAAGIVGYRKKQAAVKA